MRNVNPLYMLNSFATIPSEIKHPRDNGEREDFRKQQIEVMLREVYLIVCLVGNNV